MTDPRTTTRNGSHASGGRNDNLSASASAGAAKAKDFASDVVDQGAEYVEQAQDVAVEKLGELEKSIRRNPIQAAAIAAGIGFVVALLARR